MYFGFARILVVAGCLSAGVAAAQVAEGGVAEGRVAERDWGRRAAVDIDKAPWNAVVRVQTNLAGRCTGTLVAPDVVLTAAHCLYNHKTRRMLGPVSLHVLSGYDRGDYAEHRLVVSLIVGPTFDGPRATSTLDGDWAVLRLESPIQGVDPLPILDQPPKSGEQAAVAGYHRDRKHVLMADVECHIGTVNPIAGGALVAHDCAATKGTSGGPLLVRRDGRWVVAGVNVAAGRTHNIVSVPDWKLAGLAHK